MQINTIEGRLTAAPEVRFTPSGTAVCNFRMISNSRWKDKDGKLQERATGFPCVAWNKNAENMGEYLRKGSRILIVGTDQDRQWDDDEGVTHYIREVRVNQITFLDPPPKGQAMGNEKEPAGTTEEPVQIPDDDIPF